MEAGTNSTPFLGEPLDSRLKPIRTGPKLGRYVANQMVGLWVGINVCRARVIEDVGGMNVKVAAQNPFNDKWGGAAWVHRADVAGPIIEEA